MTRLLNFAMFYLGWFACVVGAGRGQLWLGPAVVAVLLLVHLSLTPNRAQEGRLALVIGLLGFAVDTLQASAGLYAFTHTSVVPWLCPPWMVALWMIFATTLNSSMAWLTRRYRLAAALGALCGPASYVAGARLGAIELSPNVLVSLGGIAVVWAFAMPTLLMIRDMLSKPTPALEFRHPANAPSDQRVVPRRQAERPLLTHVHSRSPGSASIPSTPGCDQLLECARRDSEDKHAAAPRAEHAVP